MEKILIFFSIDLLVLCFQSIEYEVGDVLEVLPGQSLAAVDAFKSVDVI